MSLRSEFTISFYKSFFSSTVLLTTLSLLQLLEPFKNEKLKRDIDELCEYGVMSRITQLAKRYLYCNPEDEDEDVDD